MINSREEWFLVSLTNLQIVAITEREIPFTTLSIAKIIDSWFVNANGSSTDLE